MKELIFFVQKKKLKLNSEGLNKLPSTKNTFLTNYFIKWVFPKNKMGEKKREKFDTVYEVIYFELLFL